MGDITLEARPFSGGHFCGEVQKNRTICKWWDHNIQSRFREMIQSPVGKQGILLVNGMETLNIYQKKIEEKDCSFRVKISTKISRCRNKAHETKFLKKNSSCK